MKRRASTSSTSSASSASSEELPIPKVTTEVSATAEENIEDVEDEPFNPPPELVSAYEALMRDRVELANIAPALPDASSAPASAPATTLTPAASSAPPATTDADADAAAEAALGRPLTKAEKQNAKKKRRKERERAMKAALEAAAAPEAPPPKNDIVQFPLFAAPAEVNLDDTEYYEVTRNPRLTPLPAEVRERIHRLAEEAQFAHENYPVLPPPRSEQHEIRTKAKELPRSFVAHFPDSKHAKGHGWSHINVFLPPVPEPEEEEISKSKRRKMRRQNAAWREVAVGDFYRSGKANGYGWNF